MWWQEGGYLVFGDIGNNRRMQWSPGAGVTLRQEPTNEANGPTKIGRGASWRANTSPGVSPPGPGRQHHGGGE